MIDQIQWLIQNWEVVGNLLLQRFKDHKFLLQALKGLRNGLVYGVRIRAPHALVMVFLFGEGTIIEKLLTIIRLTRIHATNLAKFVFSYKFLQGAFSEFDSQKKPWHSFVAAFLMGYYVFGTNNAVNMQINLYLLSRVVVGLVKLAASEQIISQPKFPVFPWFAAAVWGIVLWLFEFHPEVLQGSLQKSMTYLYHDSNFWTDIKTFLLRNK
uniref:Peroxisomal membrane protein 4 n=1 Tax=Caenorhabditis japonica TaxID=281687 RepID=A0A8R1DGK0_CAEJA